MKKVYIESGEVVIEQFADVDVDGKVVKQIVSRKTIAFSALGNYRLDPGNNAEIVDGLSAADLENIEAANNPAAGDA